MCFSPYLGVWGAGGGAPQGPGAQPAYVVFEPRQLKNGRSSPLFEVLIVLCGPLKRPMGLWGPMGAYGDLWVLGGGGLPRGLGHNLLM